MQEEFFEAIKIGNIEKVKQLVTDCKVDVESRNGEGQNALILAIFSHKMEIVKYLINEAHADINACGPKGETMILYGIASGNIEAIKYLVEECHLDINKPAFVPCKLANDAHNGVSYITLCALHFSKDTLKFLVEEMHAKVTEKDINNDKIPEETKEFLRKFI